MAYSGNLSKPFVFHTDSHPFNVLRDVIVYIKMMYSHMREGGGRSEEERERD